MAWQEDFINIENNNIYLKLEDYSKKSIFDLMNNYSNDNYNEVKNIYLNCSRNLINMLIENNLNLENKKDNKQKELTELNLEYQTLKDSEDIELPSLNENTDKVLIENNIESIPLYKCIEFFPFLLLFSSISIAKSSDSFSLFQ